MALTAGTSLGAYTITASLGAGGMGEVYRATDASLKRDVAIKVLPPSLATDAGRLARFQREAETLAALNHSNIAQIFGLEKFAGGTALVMELVEGPTLADRIASGAIPVDEALGIAMQIAAALEAAHAQGIVHRDLKPANVKVRPDGTVKVLDFGIAKALETRSVSGPQAASLTTPAMTQAGLVLGTAGYMAPEQARGKAVDERADIWAFGAVLYEMLTGQPAFGGEDVTVTLARVLERPPNFAQLPAAVSPAVRRTLDLCLEKDPRWRIADIRDVRLMLAGRFETVGARPRGDAATPPWRRALPVAAALLMGGASVGLVGWSLWPEPEPKPKPVKRFVMPLPPGQTLARGDDNNVLDISADGMTLVYNTAGGLRLRDLATLEDRAIPSTDQVTSGPVFSPDGQWIAYISAGGIRRIAASGGPVMPVLSRTVAFRGALRWTPDGALLFADVGIMRVPATGGTPELIVDAATGLLNSAELLPDGDTILFASFAPPRGSGDVYAQSLSTGERTPVVGGGSNARYVPTGHIVYAAGNTLWGIAFDPKTKRTRGSAVPLVEGVSRSAITGATAYFALADDGTLAYVRGLGGGATARRLVWVDRDGRETPIAAPMRTYLYVALSPDETRTALDIRDQENDTWVFDLERETLQRLTFDPGNNRGAVFSPDGRRIAFSRELGGTEEIYWQAADGSGSPEALTAGSGMPMHPVDITADGATLLYTTSNLPRDIFIIPVAGPPGPGTPLVTGPANEGSPTVSPDGRWLAYSSDESGSYEIYVRPFPDVDAGRWQISSGGGIHPQWSRDGTELFYLDVGEDTVALLAVPVESGQTFRPGVPSELFAGPYFYAAVAAAPDVYDISADGQRFIMIKQLEAQDEGQTQPEIVIVENWFEELKRLVPVE